MPVRVLRAHRLAEEATNQVAVQPRTRSSTASRAPTCPTASCSSRSRCGAARASTPVEADDRRATGVVALEGEAVVLPAADEDALYDDVADAELATAPVRLIPYFAWGNRGAGEMSVWLPLVW